MWTGKNLTCSGDGLIVGDDGTTINLNGFGIYDPGADSSKVGIGVSEDNVVIIDPGNITGFQAGILVTGGASLSIESVKLQGNQIGVFLTGSTIVSIKENTIKNNNIDDSYHILLQGLRS